LEFGPSSTSSAGAAGIAAVTPAGGTRPTESAARPGPSGAASANSGGWFERSPLRPVGWEPSGPRRPSPTGRRFLRPREPASGSRHPPRSDGQRRRFSPRGSSGLSPATGPRRPHRLSDFGEGKMRRLERPSQACLRGDACWWRWASLRCAEATAEAAHHLPRPQGRSSLLPGVWRKVPPGAGPAVGASGFRLPSVWVPRFSRRLAPQLTRCRTGP